jgi:hypothetical protein
VTLKLGIALILASALPWLALPLAAWWAPSIVAKVAWSTGLLVASEALFWAGVLLAGRDVWAAAKQAGWRRMVPQLWGRLHSAANKVQEMGRR